MKFYVGAIFVIGMIAAGCSSVSDERFERSVGVHNLGESGRVISVNNAVVKNEFGGHASRDAAIEGFVSNGLVGGVAGALVGAVASASANNKSGVRYQVELDDGRVIDVIQPMDSETQRFKPGDAVSVETSGTHQRVVAR